MVAEQDGLPHTDTLCLATARSGYCKDDHDSASYMDLSASPFYARGLASAGHHRGKSAGRFPPR